MKKKFMKVLAFGEILWDVIDGVEHLGGAPFNFAAHSAQCGNESFIISRLGNDVLGRRAYDMVKDHGVDRAFIQWDEAYPTGIVDVTLTAGQPDYFIRENAAYDHIDYDGPATLSAHNFDVFYFGSLAQRGSRSADTLFRIISDNPFRHIFYDVNLRKNGFTKEIITRSLAVCTIFKLNMDEVSVISEMLAGQVLGPDDFCRFLKSRFSGIRLIVITASEKGCFVFGDQLVAIPGRRVEVCDAVGAGDAFSASFMYEYLSTGDPLQAARVANQVGAYVATQQGAIPQYTDAISALLASSGETRQR